MPKLTRSARISCRIEAVSFRSMSAAIWMAAMAFVPAGKYPRAVSLHGATDTISRGGDTAISVAWSRCRRVSVVNQANANPITAIVAMPLRMTSATDRLDQGWGDRLSRALAAGSGFGVAL